MHVKRLIQKTYEELKAEHGFSCGLEEEKLSENYAMVIDHSENNIVYDPKNVQKMYREGRIYGAYKFDFPIFIRFCMTHELGHYYDFQENPDKFTYRNKDEYIQMELRGIKKAMELISTELVSEFYSFNQLSIEHYQRDLSE